MGCIIDRANKGFQFVHFSFCLGKGLFDVPYPDHSISIWVRTSVVSGSGCPRPDTSCALRSVFTLIVYGVIRVSPRLAVLRYKVDGIWCGSLVVPRF